MKSKLPKKNISGLRLAAAYGLTPNKLGFCGPQKKEHKILYAFLVDEKNEKKAREILFKFEGASAYYDLIAQKNKIKNIFDQKVVEAYWIGNKLLDKISSEDIKKMVREKFISPLLLDKKEAEKRIRKIPMYAKPHHSFHVLILGPVAGRIDLTPINLKDICRVGWGKIISVKNNKIEVKYQPLIRKNYQISFGKAEAKKINWDRNIIPKLEIGDWISFHWNSAVQILDKENIKNLEKYTKLSF
jgi:hypothetical protein